MTLDTEPDVMNGQYASNPGTYGPMFSLDGSQNTFLDWEFPYGTSNTDAKRTSFWKS